MQLTNPPHSLSLSHPHLVLAVTAASHPPPAYTLSAIYVNSCTVSTSSHDFSSCFNVSQIFPSHFLHAKLLSIFGVWLLTPAHLLWNHFPHCTHKTELVFTPKLLTPHGSTLLLDMPSFVMLPLTITLAFPMLTFNPLLSKASFHFRNLSLSPSSVSLIRTKSSTYSNSLSAPSGQFCDIYHKWKKKWWQHRSLLHSQSCLCSFIQIHWRSDQDLWYPFLPRCQFQHFPWYSVKGFL